MDTSKFLKQIRSIIREEIEYALDKKMNESKKKDDVKTLSHGMNLMKEIGVIKKQQSTNKVKSSKKGYFCEQDILYHQSKLEFCRQKRY
jgi:hypothetical protein